MSALPSPAPPSEHTQMPSDNDIIHDWIRHDAFRFRNILFPALFFTLMLSGQFTATPYVSEVIRLKQYYAAWGDSELELWQNKLFLRVVVAGCAPLLASILTLASQQYILMIMMSIVSLLGYLAQILGFLFAANFVFNLGLISQSFAWGVLYHIMLVTLLQWFPDFHVFVIAGIALMQVLSHALNSAVCTFIAQHFSLPVLPIFEAFIFAMVILLIRDYIQPPPAYLPIFIRSMLHAVSLPHSSTVSLPTTLGFAARIPRALGKLQQWKRRLKSRGARRGYGELVSDEVVDEIEQLEMQIASGFDLEDNLDDLYNDTAASSLPSSLPSYPHNTGTFSTNQSEQQQQQQHQQLNKPPQQLRIKPPQTSNNQDDVLEQLAQDSDADEQLPENYTHRDTNPPTAQNEFNRTGDEADDGEPGFALDSEAESREGEPSASADLIDQEFVDSAADVNITTSTTTVQHPPASASAYKHSVPTLESNEPPHTNHDQLVLNIVEDPQERHTPNFVTEPGAALYAVVANLDQYHPLSLLALCHNTQFIMFAIASFATSLFPFFLMRLGPVLFQHLQNRSLEGSWNTFTTCLYVAMGICPVLLIASQFMGSRGMLTVFSATLTLSYFVWPLLAVMGSQLDPAAASHHLSPMHYLIIVIFTAFFASIHLLIPTAQKYFHDENIRMSTALFFFFCVLSFIVSPVITILRESLIDNSKYSPSTFIALNAEAYNWPSRCALVISVFALILFTKLRPLAVSERRFAQ